VNVFSFFLQGKAPKEIHAILTEILPCFLPGRAKDLSAPMYNTSMAFCSLSLSLSHTHTHTNTHTQCVLLTKSVERKTKSSEQTQFHYLSNTPNFLRAKNFLANMYRKEDRRNAYTILVSKSEEETILK